MASGAAPAPRIDAARPGVVDRWLPGVGVLRTYRRAWLPQDLVAGLVLSALLVPQGMAYAELAGLPAIYGLYTTVVCLVAYAAVRAVAGAGAGAGLGAGGDDRRRRAAAGGRERGAGGRAWPARWPCWSAWSAARPGRCGWASSPTCSPGRSGWATWPGWPSTIVVGQLPKLFGFSIDADGLLRELAAILAEPGPDQPLRAGHRPGRPGAHPGPAALAPRIPGVLVAVAVSLVARRRLRPGGPGGGRRRRPAPGLPRPEPPRGGAVDLPLLRPPPSGSRWWPSATPSPPQPASPPGAGSRSTPTRSWSGSARPTSWPGFFQGFPVSTSGSRTAVAEQSGRQDPADRPGGGRRASWRCCCSSPG